MAVVAPFRGVRFNPDKIEELDDVVTPPYDVINEEAGATFLVKNPYNMIQLDLRNTSQQGAETIGRYRDAGSSFESWQDAGILIRDDQPAMYLYYIDYTHPSGRKMTRKGLVALVGLAEFSECIVKPHEKTFDGVISDRLELMDECKAQFSKVFSIYHDREQAIIATLDRVKEPEPICTARDFNSNVHTVWRVTDADALATVRALFKDKSVYIADGHHRYATALAFRKRAHLRTPNLPKESPFNFIMMYLCASEDEGLSVLPTHRLVNHPGTISADDLVRKLSKGLDIQEVQGGTRETLIGEVLARMNEAEMNSAEPAFGVYHAGEDRAFLLRLKEDAWQDDVLAGKPEVLKKLDVVLLSDLLIHGYLGLSHDRCVRERLIDYFSDPDEAIDVAVKRSVGKFDSTPLLFLLNPTRVDQVTNTADSGEIMPHKSTYFYPKILTGMLINKLAGNERIAI
ncbi:MAG: DUF1015 family protein [Desulfobulbaceae bacterium]|nr:DUF1015 family protein [Desulfobulbaceae bacterium]